MKRLAVLSFFFASCLMAAAPWPDQVPKTLRQPVLDLAEMIQPESAAGLETSLRAAWKQGSLQIAVLTLPNLDRRPIEDVAITVARGWGLGDKEQDNGVLILLAKEEREIRIEVGSKLEGSLTDIYCNRIIEDLMVPRMRAGDPGAAVREAVGAIYGAVDPSLQVPGIEAVALKQKSWRGDMPWPVFIFVLCLVFGMFSGIFWIFYKIMRALGRQLKEANERVLKEMKEHPERFEKDGRRKGSGRSGGSSSGGSYSGGGGGFSGGGASGKW